MSVKLSGQTSEETTTRNFPFFQAYNKTTIAPFDQLRQVKRL